MKNRLCSTALFLYAFLLLYLFSQLLYIFYRYFGSRSCLFHRHTTGKKIQQQLVLAFFHTFFFCFITNKLISDF